jgi:hypothetical protein
MLTRKSKVTINLPPEIVEQAKMIADERGTSMSVVIERLLQEWIYNGGAVPPKMDDTAKQKRVSKPKK